MSAAPIRGDDSSNTVCGHISQIPYSLLHLSRNSTTLPNELLSFYHAKELPLYSMLNKLICRLAGVRTSTYPFLVICRSTTIATEHKSVAVASNVVVRYDRTNGAPRYSLHSCYKIGLPFCITHYLRVLISILFWITQF